MTIHIPTPLLQSLFVGKQLSGSVWLKIEAMQPSGSFKARGVGFACQRYIEEGTTALISSSGGNAGLAVAYAGRRLKVPVTVVVPTTTKQKAIELIECEGAKVIVKGEVWAQAHQHAMSLKDSQCAYIHPFDDPYLWQGHASMIDEVQKAQLKPDCIVLSVGGGGLLSGVIQGLINNGWDDVPVLAVETQGADAYAQALSKQQNLGLQNITSIATSLGATKVCDRAFELASAYSIHSHVVSDKQAVSACLAFLEDHRVLVEPACGASLATLYQGHPLLDDKKNILVIVCGGVGATVDQLKTWDAELSE